jgi:hypothetical protein
LYNYGIILSLTLTIVGQIQQQCRTSVCRCHLVCLQNFSAKG